MDNNFENMLSPLKWHEHDDHVSLRLEAGEKEEIFEIRADEGFEAGGYGWEALARVFLDEKMPELKEDINFDSEGSSFGAYSCNIEAMKKFALGIRAMFDDDELMKDLLSRASDEFL